MYKYRALLRKLWGFLAVYYMALLATDGSTFMLNLPSVYRYMNVCVHIYRALSRKLQGFVAKIIANLFWRWMLAPFGSTCMVYTSIYMCVRINTLCTYKYRALLRKLQGSF